MNDRRRGRACDACHGIKVKCELGTDGSARPPCGRCLRLDKKCHVTAPKRQKDRVAELEAQVAKLTKLLQAQTFSEVDQTTRDNPGGKVPALETAAIQPDIDSSYASTATKKRRLENDSDSTARGDVQEEAGQVLYSPQLDDIISEDMQRRLVRKYVDQMLPLYPFVQVPKETTWEWLRANKPLLLKAICYGAAAGVLSPDDQERLTKFILAEMARKAIASGEKSVELVQALQVSSLWFRSPRSHRHVASYQFIQLMLGSAIDIGLGGPDTSPSLGLSTCDDEFEPVEAWRTWLVCHSLSTAMGIMVRRPLAQTWTGYHSKILDMLETDTNVTSSDWSLCYYVRGERLCGEIAKFHAFDEFSMLRDLSDPATVTRMQTFYSEIQQLTDSHLHVIRQPLFFWPHIALLYLYEPVLHTATNKRTFAAPYLAEALSPQDFARPIVTSQHNLAVQVLTSSCNAMIDIVCAAGVHDLLVSPNFLVFSRIAYALRMLLSLYIAATGPANTLGAIVSIPALQIERNLKRINDTAVRVARIDERALMACLRWIVDGSRAWLEAYDASLNGLDSASEASTMMEMPSFLPTNDSLSEPSIASNVDSARDGGTESNDFWNELLLSTTTDDGSMSLDFGLNEIFAEPDWFHTCPSTYPDQSWSEVDEIVSLPPG